MTPGGSRWEPAHVQPNLRDDHLGTVGPDAGGLVQSGGGRRHRRTRPGAADGPVLPSAPMPWPAAITASCSLIWSFTAAWSAASSRSSWSAYILPVVFTAALPHQRDIDRWGMMTTEHRRHRPPGYSPSPASAAPCRRCHTSPTTSRSAPRAAWVSSVARYGSPVPSREHGVGAGAGAVAYLSRGWGPLPDDHLTEALFRPQPCRHRQDRGNWPTAMPSTRELAPVCGCYA